VTGARYQVALALTEGCALDIEGATVGGARRKRDRLDLDE